MDRREGERNQPPGNKEACGRTRQSRPVGHVYPPVTPSAFLLLANMLPESTGNCRSSASTTDIPARGMGEGELRPG
jgi:hypothetical protein